MWLKLQEVNQDASGNKKISAETVTEVDVSKCQRKLDSLTRKVCTYVVLYCVFCFIIYCSSLIRTDSNLGILF